MICRTEDMSLDFIPAPNIIWCAAAVYHCVYAVCRFAPETIRVNGRLSSNVYELLISHRVKSRTPDLRVLQCRCLWQWWLRQRRKTYLVALLQWVTHCRTVKKEATALCRTSKQCVLCISQVSKHSRDRSIMLVSSQLRKEQILPLNDLLRLVFESHWKKKCQLQFAGENENKSVM